jgi:AraC-like DNA-binding protein
LIIEFKEGGAAAFLDLPLHELYESSVGLDELFKSSALAELLERMHSRKLMQEKVLLVQDFLISKLRQTKSDFLILSAVESIKLAHGAISVKQLAESLHTSLDPFEKRFRKVIGATPKQFADIIRMKSLIDRRNNQHLLVDTCLEAGFFDQSHFIRTFKKFTGQTPKHFFRSAEYQPD